jgi:hypothetical protein
MSDIMQKLFNEAETHTKPFLEYLIDLLRAERDYDADPTVTLSLICQMFEKEHMYLNPGKYNWSASELDGDREGGA